MPECTVLLKTVTQLGNRATNVDWRIRSFFLTSRLLLLKELDCLAEDA